LFYTTSNLTTVATTLNGYRILFTSPSFSLVNIVNGQIDSFVNCTTPTPTTTNTETPTSTPTPTNTETPTSTPTPTNTETPTPTPTSGATDDGWLFYTPEGPLSAPPDANGNTLFINDALSTFNPNYRGDLLEFYFNNNDNVGTSYLSQFQELDTNGGTITISQGINTVIYSGTSSQYILPTGYITLQVNSPSQMIQSASTAFVSGVTINVTVN
jgi:hypothetical protein